jgi:cytochrome c oxidase subunit 4
MAETHGTHAHDDHHDAHPEPNYMGVFYILCACTLVSFITVSTFWVSTLGAQTGHTVVMLVAVIKALLVAMYFMHLKYDWFRIYGMLTPTVIMGTFLVLALLPDITFSDTRVTNGVDDQGNYIKPNAARVLGEEPAPAPAKPAAGH